MNNRILIAGAFVVSLAACTEDTTDFTPADGGGVTQPDSGTTMPPPDAGTIAEDAGPMTVDAGPARTLVTRRLYGEGPINNLVFDPDLDVASFNWFAISGDGFNLQPVEKHFLSRTPTGQPALRVPKTKFSRGTFLFGSAASASAPIEISVWVGRATDVAASTATVGATIVGVGPEGSEVAYDLMPDAASTLVLGDITWIRLTTMITDALGVLSFLVGDETDVAFYVTAPAVVPARATSLAGTRLKSLGRPLAAREKRAFDRFLTAKRDRDDPRDRVRMLRSAAKRRIDPRLP
jgi:hypothetical protein